MDVSQDIPRPPRFLCDLYDIPSESTLFTTTTGRLRSSGKARPYVTLTFAQSSDAKIAGPGGTQVALSGEESMLMTHWMRTMHDAILVGIGTALNDDPQLNVRHLPPLPAGTRLKYHLPRPVILDAHLRLRPDCKLLKNYQASNGRRPWVFCLPTGSQDEGFIARAETLRNAGARIFEVPGDGESLSLPAVLTVLYDNWIESVMVEGGAKVINSFLNLAREEDVVDTLIVTQAPVRLGEDAVGYGTNILAGGGAALPDMVHVATAKMGPDNVVAFKRHRS
ncbi:dihydrofolate reductase [Gloeophyllum trabeum ATCC 11539]|uniref:2,5-diamino-6-ribosylamino-4(3H)-pyrimidinone 5'-phosphate reductase n=1 Tax=Gloeophyllum trabeum (strain ATCC 11539 / FP-39264 / Madison 617) TaxID=670483 RepID=S7QLL5_GLOTA|nr:dihydrofolate reductase [Gloeophyllum trabeum ATCC 11539]EPQ60287.1 dihydrofolate reductase [Gloeophyllum trabeum ATCC 11539]